MIGPGGARGLGFGGGADCADHHGARVLEPLDQQQPDPARRGMDQHRPARLNLGAAFDQKFGGRGLEQRGRSGTLVDIVGQNKQAGGGHVARAGVST